MEDMVDEMVDDVMEDLADDTKTKHKNKKNHKKVSWLDINLDDVILVFLSPIKDDMITFIREIATISKNIEIINAY